MTAGCDPQAYLVAFQNNDTKRRSRSCGGRTAGLDYLLYKSTRLLLLLAAAVSLVVVTLLQKRLLMIPTEYHMYQLVKSDSNYGQLFT